MVIVNIKVYKRIYLIRDHVTYVYIFTVYVYMYTNACMYIYVYVYMYMYVMYTSYALDTYIHVYIYLESISTSSCSLSATEMTAPKVGFFCFRIQGFHLKSHPSPPENSHIRQ